MDLLKTIYIFVTLFIFVGCTKNVTTLQSNSTVPTKENIIDKVEVDNKTVIVYAGSMKHSEQMLLIIDEYNKQSEDVIVRYQELPLNKEKRYNEIVDKLKLSNSEFDIIEIELPWNSEFANKKYSYPLNDYIKNDAFDVNVYIKNSIKAVTFKNNIYALPKSISTPMLYYKKDNETMLPKTWEDIIDYYQMSEKSNAIKYRYVFEVKPSEELVIEALEIIYSYGGQIFDESFNISFEKENNIKSLNKFYEIYHLDFISEDLKTSTLEDLSIKFSEENILFMRNYYRNFQNNNVYKVKNLGISTLPMGDNGLVTILDGNANIINNYSKNKYKAWDFLKFATGYKAQKILAVNSNEIPSLLDLYTDKEVILSNPYFNEKPFINAINSAVEPLKTTEYNKTIEIFQDELVKFLNDEKSAELMMADLETRLRLIK